jgi:hypothetical protein
MLSALGREFHENDIRFIFHAVMPVSLRDYIQETGRGGRDFQQAHCKLFFSFFDRAMAENVVLGQGKSGGYLQGDKRVRAEVDLQNVVDYAMSGDACRYSLLAKCGTIEEADPMSQSCKDDTSCDNCRDQRGSSCTRPGNPVWTICSETGDKMSEVCFSKTNVSSIIIECLSKGLAKSQKLTDEAQVETCFRRTVKERFAIETDRHEKFLLLNFLERGKSLLIDLVRYLRMDSSKPKQRSEDGTIIRTDWGKVKSVLKLVSSGNMDFFVQSARVSKLKDTAAALNNAATSGDSNSTRKQGGSDETMLKTVTMEQPSISERNTPMSMCSQDVVAAVAVSSRNNGTSRSPGSTVPVPDYSKCNGSVYERSMFQVPNLHTRIVVEADHEEFAPNKYICFTQCVGDQARARTYARVYENRMETNYPYSPWCCFTPEYCIVDNVQVYSFDKGPSQQYCGGHYVECDCLGPLCGPPVVFVNVPRCCCHTLDLRPCFGETLYAAPCDCYGLRCCICTGRPCYQQCACPIAGPIKNGSFFLERYRGAVDDYAKIRPVKRHTVFNRVSEKPCGFIFDKATMMAAHPIDVSLQHCTDRLKLIPGAISKALIMDRF